MRLLATPTAIVLVMFAPASGGCGHDSPPSTIGVSNHVLENRAHRGGPNGGPIMKLDDVLEAASSSDFSTYDPTTVINAVNALVSLGKDGALAAIDKFLARQDPEDNPRQGLFLVLRVLFDADPHPPLRLGGAPLGPPRDPAAMPRFPIVVVDDVPLMLISGYTLAGLPEPLSSHLDYYRNHGTLRAAPLTPAQGVDRRAAFAKVYQSAYGAPPEPGVRGFIDDQLHRLQL
jgi:hypothetical protein